MIFCRQRIGPSSTSCVYTPSCGVMPSPRILQSCAGVNHSHKRGCPTSVRSPGPRHRPRASRASTRAPFALRGIVESTPRSLTLGWEGRATIRVPTVTVARGYYVRPEPPGVMHRAAKAANAWRSTMHGRLSLCEALFQGLPSHVQGVSAALRELIEREHAVVRQGDLTRHREVSPADQPDIQ